MNFINKSFVCCLRGWEFIGDGYGFIILQSCLVNYSAVKPLLKLHLELASCRSANSGRSPMTSTFSFPLVLTELYPLYLVLDSSPALQYPKCAQNVRFQTFFHYTFLSDMMGMLEILNFLYPPPSPR